MMDPTFIVPLFVLLIPAIGIGLWQGQKHGAARGLRAGAIALGIGAIVLAALLALATLYVASGVLSN